MLKKRERERETEKKSIVSLLFLCSQVNFKTQPYKQWVGVFTIAFYPNRDRATDKVLYGMQFLFPFFFSCCVWYKNAHVSIAKALL